MTSFPFWLKFSRSMPEKILLKFRQYVEKFKEGSVLFYQQCCKSIEKILYLSNKLTIMNCTEFSKNCLHQKFSEFKGYDLSDLHIHNRQTFKRFLKSLFLRKKTNRKTTEKMGTQDVQNELVFFKLRIFFSFLYVIIILVLVFLNI